MTFFSHLFHYFLQCLQKQHLHLYFIHTNLNISATSLNIFSYTRGKAAYYENLQKEKAQDTEPGRVDVPVWHIYKAQEK